MTSKNYGVKLSKNFQKKIKELGINDYLKE